MPSSPSPSVNSSTLLGSPLRSGRPVAESSYMEYLQSARLRIHQCAQSCQTWSAPYDGETPSPDSTLRSETTKSSQVATSVKSAEEKTVERENSNTETQRNSANINDKNEKITGENETTGNFQSQTVSSEQNKTVESELTSDSPIEESLTQSQTEQGISENSSHAHVNNASNDPKQVTVNEEQQNSDMKNDSNNYAESVCSEADSALSGNSVNTEQTQSLSRSDSPLADNFDNADFNSFLLSLKRVQTPVEYSESIEACLNEIDSLVVEFKKFNVVQKPSITSMSSQEDCGVQSPSEKPSKSPSLWDLSKDTVSSLPKSVSMETMHVGAVIKPSISSVSLNPSAIPVITPARYNLGKPDIGESYVATCDI